jgi:hypothetical protein
VFPAAGAESRTVLKDRRRLGCARRAEETTERRILCLWLRWSGDVKAKDGYY